MGTAITKEFLPGDVESQGCLTGVQQALVTVLTATQLLNHMAQYLRAGLRMGTTAEQLRELITFCAICCMGGCEPQATSHAAANLGIGNGRELLIDAVAQCLPFNGFPRTLNALGCIDTVCRK